MRVMALAAGAAAAISWTATAAAATWDTPVARNVVADAPIVGGGYPVPPGATKPDPGTCRVGRYDSNRSESWIAVKPGTETLVGTSKLFFENFSTFYDFHLGAFAIHNGAVTGQSQVQGYDCVSTGTQAMPPSWTNNTDPNVDFDTQGRAYQTTLPFNAFWEGGLHPNGAIDLSYSDDLGLHWIKGNGGRDLEPNNNQTSLTLGHVEDKQWVAVNHIPGNRFQDHVYAMWTTFNGAIDISLQAYKDRGTAAGATPVGANARVSQFTWDPDQPQQKVGELTQYACAGHTDPCPLGRGFIGDYFGLAISASNIYTFGVSTHYPSATVRADDGGPVYYQNQVLGITPRTAFGADF